jgi:hypothetical protein
MSERTDRLKRLLDVQGKLLKLHETRRAGYLAHAAEARADADDLARRVDQSGALTALFPDLYSRRIASALDRETASLAAAAVEARRVAEADIRTKRVAEAHGEAERGDERRQEEVDALEIVERFDAGAKGASLK